MNNEKNSPRVVSATIDNIPVIYIAPEQPTQAKQLVIWIPYFTGTKEAMQPYLEQLVAAGFIALSLDPWQHGERGTEAADVLSKRVFSNFRRNMWPILGQTALDVLRVIDWAVETLEISGPISIGGISMGGDISVAAAGLDKRIRTVAAIVATPDWLRPGMHKLKDPSTLAATGTPDAYADYFYDHINPLTHLEAYAHRPAITFECGALDTHVPPDGALRFLAALQKTYEAQSDRLRVTLHPDVGHYPMPDAMWENCLNWFKTH